MKIGVVGKGGVGKTTVSSLLARTLAADGNRVVAIDTDSNPNLGLSLGLSLTEVDAVPPLPRSLMVGAGTGTTADELLAEYGTATPAGPMLLSAIRVTEAGAGCTCGGHATVRGLLRDALTEHADVTVVDMEAGLEHLSRAGGTLAYVDVLLAVMEPSRKSVLTVARTLALAEELGIPRTLGVGNKARLPEDADFFAELCAEYGVELAAVVPYDDEVTAADRTGRQLPGDGSHPASAAIEELVRRLDPVPAG